MKKTKIKISLILIGISSLMAFTSIASATSLHSNINMENGMAIIEYIANNNTTKIQINGSACIEINANNSSFDYEINSIDNCTINSNNNGNNEIKSTIKEKDENLSDVSIYISTFFLMISCILYIIMRIFFSRRVR